MLVGPVLRSRRSNFMFPPNLVNLQAMTLNISHFVLIAALLLSCSAYEEPPPQLPPTPIEAHLATVAFEVTTPIPEAIQVEITPEHIRISTERLASAWRRTSQLRDAQIIEAGPWWCEYFREYCLKRKAHRRLVPSLGPLPVFPDILLKDGEIPESLRKGGQKSLYIMPLFEQLTEANKYKRRMHEFRRESHNAEVTVAVDERIPLRTIAALIYSARQAEIRVTSFLVNAPDSTTRAIPYIMSEPPHWHEYPDGFAEATFSPLPLVRLRPGAAYIHLRVARTPEETNKPLDRRSAAQGLINDLDMVTGRVNGERIDVPKQDWQDRMLVPEAKGRESLRFTANAVPAGEITKLLERYDEAEFYPGFVLAAQGDVTFGAWIKVLAELQSVEVFRGVYDTVFELD